MIYYRKQCAEVNDVYCLFRVETEIWNFESGQNRTTNPTLASDNYSDFGIYLVDKDYCKLSNE